jgi:hypothetical protein
VSRPRSACVGRIDLRNLLRRPWARFECPGQAACASNAPATLKIRLRPSGRSRIRHAGRASAFTAPVAVWDTQARSALWRPLGAFGAFRDRFPIVVGDGGMWTGQLIGMANGPLRQPAAVRDRHEHVSTLIKRLSSRTLQVTSDEVCDQDPQPAGTLRRYLHGQRCPREPGHPWQGSRLADT